MTSNGTFCPFAKHRIIATNIEPRSGTLKTTKRLTNLAKKYSFSDIGNDRRYSNMEFSFSFTKVLTVLTKIKIGRMRLHACMKIKRSLVSPVNPLTRLSEIPDAKILPMPISRQSV